jgi:hypothetical protein
VAILDLVLGRARVPTQWRRILIKPFVLIPQLIEARWNYRFLHNQREMILRNELLRKGETESGHHVPWQIEKHAATRK